MAKKPTKPARPPISGKPHDLTPDAWFYDARGGIEITHWVTAGVDKGHRQAAFVKIPWAKLRAALARNGKL